MGQICMNGTTQISNKYGWSYRKKHGWNTASERYESF